MNKKDNSLKLDEGLNTMMIQISKDMNLHILTSKNVRAHMILRALIMYTKTAPIPGPPECIFSLDIQVTISN